jgi:hypothetical protein
MDGNTDISDGPAIGGRGHGDAIEGRISTHAGQSDDSGEGPSASLVMQDHPTIANRPAFAGGEHLDSANGLPGWAADGCPVPAGVVQDKGIQSCDRGILTVYSSNGPAIIGCYHSNAIQYLSLRTGRGGSWIAFGEWQIRANRRRTRVAWNATGWGDRAGWGHGAGAAGALAGRGTPCHDEQQQER